MNHAFVNGQNTCSPYGGVRRRQPVEQQMRGVRGGAHHAHACDRATCPRAAANVAASPTTATAPTLWVTVRWPLKQEVEVRRRRKGSATDREPVAGAVQARWQFRERCARRDGPERGRPPRRRRLPPARGQLG